MRAWATARLLLTPEMTNAILASIAKGHNSEHADWFRGGLRVNLAARPIRPPRRRSAHVLKAVERIRIPREFLKSSARVGGVVLSGKSRTARKRFRESETEAFHTD